MDYGYARVSSTDQSVDLQIEALKAAGCSVVRSEKVSGTSLEGRAELATLLDFIREGDTLVVVRLDRLARSVADLLGIVKRLREKGAALKTLDGMSFDDSAVGTVIMTVLAAFAQFETSLRRERQMAGIAAAKAKGVYRGRPHTIDATAVQALKGEGHGPAEIARRLKISRASVYRLSPVQTLAKEPAQARDIRWQVALGEQVVASGFPTREAATLAARRLAEEKGSLPYEVRPVPGTQEGEGRA